MQTANSANENAGIVQKYQTSKENILKTAVIEVNFWFEY